MGWNDKGADRLRKFKLFQEWEKEVKSREKEMELEARALEESRAELEIRARELEAEVRRQSAVIRKLSGEAPADGHKVTKSGTRLAVHDILAQLEQAIVSGLK